MGIHPRLVHYIVTFYLLEMSNNYGQQQQIPRGGYGPDWFYNRLPPGWFTGQSKENFTYRWVEATAVSIYTKVPSFMFWMQLITGLFFVGFAICYLVELFGPQYISHWAAYLTYAIAGGVIIIILQGAAYIVFYRGNMADTGITSPTDPSGTAHLSAAYMKELFYAFWASVFVWGFSFWIYLGWLVKQSGGSCCTGPVITTAVPIDYNTYKQAITFFTALQIFGFVIMLRVFFVHLNPLGTIRSVHKEISLNNPAASRR